MSSSNTSMVVFEHNNTLAEENLPCAEHVPQESSDEVLAFLIITLILCVLGNSAVCIIVSRHHQLHTVTNAYFVNMAVIQLLFALFSIPPYLRISSSSLQAGKSWLCVFIGFTFELFAALSNLALTLVTIERYHVINNLGRKKISAKTTRRLIVFAIVWALTFAVLWTVLSEGSTTCLTSSTLSCFPLLSAHKNETLRILNIIYILMCFLLPMAIMAGIFIKMSKSLWSGFHKVRPLGAGNPNTIRFFAEIKTARTMFFISVLHLCCWLPLCIISLYLSSPRKADKRHLRLSTAKVVSICLALSSSCTNPLMYALRNPRFSIIFRPNKRSHGKKRVKFHKDQENQENATAKTISSWAQRSICAVVYDASRSEETQTTSSC